METVLDRDRPVMLRGLSIEGPDDAPPARFLAVESFAAENANIELSFEAGDILEEVGGVTAPAGWRHCQLGDMIGLVPEDFLDEYHGDASDSPPPAPVEHDFAPAAAVASNVDGGDSEVDDGVRVCVEDFKPEVGALNELGIAVGDRVLLLDVGEMQVAEGWVIVRHLETEQDGMVPEDYIDRPAKDDEETEEQAALRLQKERNAQLEVELERTREAAAADVREAERLRELEVEKAEALTEAEAEKRKVRLLLIASDCL